MDDLQWLYFEEKASEGLQAAQRERQQADCDDSVIGARCCIARSAAVFPDRLWLGDDSHFAAHSYVTGQEATGTNCTLNSFATVRGQVTLGNGAISTVNAS